MANQRVQCNAAAQVVLKLKTAGRDGTTHLVMSQLEFKQRMAMLALAQHFEDDRFQAFNLLVWRPALGA